MKTIQFLHTWWHTRAEKSSVMVMFGLHLLALGVCVPYFFSWSGVLWFVLFYWISGGLGITLCYHRLLTHKSFKTPKWVRAVLVTFGCLASQGAPMWWVGVHRLHHRHSDTPDDPHSPRDGFSWAHMLWLLSKPEGSFVAEQYARDLAREPVMRWYERFWWVPQLTLTTLLFTGGLVFKDWVLGVSWVLWGVVFRTVVVYHATWFVNSATHTWGYQNFDNTGDDSRNLWWVALLSFGEGWHNNHHGDEHSASHGMRWFEIDPTYWTIKFMQCVGLASDIKKPRMTF
jgi:fatty-acid desaturase